MTDQSRRSAWMRPLIIIATGVLAWAALLIGQQFATVTVVVGDPSPETFVSTIEFSVEDDAETQRRVQVAEDAVEPLYQRDTDIDALVIEEIQVLFDGVRAGTVVADAAPLVEVTTTTLPTPTTVVESTTTTETIVTGDGEEDATTTTEAPTTTTTVPEVPRTASIHGQLFIDIDGDALFTEGIDHGLEAVRIFAYDPTDEERDALTNSMGEFTISGLVAGEGVVLVDTRTIPQRLGVDESLLMSNLDLVEDGVTEVGPIPLTVVVVPAESQELNLESRALLSAQTVDVLVEIATEDVTREILGLDPWLNSVEEASARRATSTLSDNDGILATELEDVRNSLRTSTFFVALPGADADLVIATASVVTEVAAEFLQPNKSIDENATAIERSLAAQAVEPAMLEYMPGDVIVPQGVEITALVEEALQESGLLTKAAPRYAALAAVVALVVLMLSFYLGRFRPVVWNSMRRMALFGMLIVLAALSARLIAVFATENPAAGYLIPAAAFGLMAAILFDARIAVLMSMAVGSMTAIATLDPGYTLFATLATLTPVPFVSSISARRELRVAVLYMMLMLAALAGGVAWFFQDGATAREAVFYGALNGFLSGLVGSALLSFFESIFDVTTSLRLLDLTDRNHPGLRLLEDKAIGTFNHSLMVGTLADQAARAVDANPLLARAAAYYHDLGKTENPQFFIENQFGIQNPHDRMPPEESAHVIRQHVIDGRRLAKQFRIPEAVAEGVTTHHGDGIMQFFYARAIERYGEERVDIEDYRHVGRKPTSKEMAIVMMADSVEGACRAIFQVEEPSAERITEAVEQVVGEKVADGQLSECSLTLGDLTRAKAAMVDALIGYYHQRIPYPNFPTRGGLDGGDDGSEDDLPTPPPSTADGLQQTDRPR